MTTGASNDLEKASQIARDMAMRYGMGGDDLGPVTYGEKQGTIFLGVDPSMSRNYSEQKAQQIDAFVKETIEKQYDRALGMLRQHRAKLNDLAKILLKQETMSIGEFEEIFSGKKPKEGKGKRGKGERA